MHLGQTRACLCVCEKCVSCMLSCPFAHVCTVSIHPTPRRRSQHVCVCVPQLRTYLWRARALLCNLRLYCRSLALLSVSNQSLFGTGRQTTQCWLARLFHSIHISALPEATIVLATLWVGQPSAEDCKGCEYVVCVHLACVYYYNVLLLLVWFVAP